MSSMVFYDSFYNALKDLPPEDFKACMSAVCEYGLNGAEIEVDGLAKVVFGLVKPQIDANIERRINGAKGAEYGKLGGRPKKENPIGVIEEETENPIGVIDETPNVNVNANANANADVRSKTRTRVFTPPTIDEVRAYCQERNNGVNPEKWMDFYAAKDWMIGKNKMKDWKAAVRTWENREDDYTKAPPGDKNTGGAQKSNPFNNYEQQQYDYDELERMLIKN